MRRQRRRNAEPMDQVGRGDADKRRVRGRLRVGCRLLPVLGLPGGVPEADVLCAKFWGRPEHAETGTLHRGRGCGGWHFHQGRESCKGRWKRGHGEQGRVMGAKRVELSPYRNQRRLPLLWELDDGAASNATSLAGVDHRCGNAVWVEWLRFRCRYCDQGRLLGGRKSLSSSGRDRVRHEFPDGGRRWRGAQEDWRRERDIRNIRSQRRQRDVGCEWGEWDERDERR